MGTVILTQSESSTELYHSLEGSEIELNGPAAGKNIMEHWDEMQRNYYHHMGWDRETGKPLPGTLMSLGLGDIISDIW